MDYNFIPDKRIVANSHIMEVDNKHHWIRIKPTRGAFVNYEYAHIIKAEVYNGDSVITTTTDAGSALGRAIVGGALFGGIGAVVGGSTASTTSNEYNNLHVRIYFDDYDSPALSIECGSDTKVADALLGTLDYIIRNTSQEEVDWLRDNNISPFSTKEQIKQGKKEVTMHNVGIGIICILIIVPVVFLLVQCSNLFDSIF